jgi:hypothetical protein
LDTTSETASPLNSVPLSGRWLITTPAVTVSDGSSVSFTTSPRPSSRFSAASALAPTTSGTLIGLRPRLTTNSTFSPGLTTVPGLGRISTPCTGSVAITVPSGTVSL